MANQAIALQARAPQADILGGAIRNNAQLINTMSQQRAAERQNAMAQQQMQLAQEKATREASAAEIDLAGKKLDLYTKRSGLTLTPQGYLLLLQDLDRDAPQIAAAFRANLPPEQFTRDGLLRMVGSVSDNFKATYGPLETEVVQMEDGTYSVARTGGFGKPGVFELEEFALKPSGAPAAAAAPTAAAPAQGDVMARPTRGANTGPQDLMRQGVNPNSIPSGNPLSPISTGSAAQPDLGAIVQNMMQTGVISQADMGLMTQAAGPEKAQQLAQIMRANNIQIMPDEQAAPAGMRNAVFRPEEGAPAFQQAQSMDDYVGTGRAARGKSPMQSPLPGSALVAPSVLGAQKSAEAQASKNAEVQAAPKIAAAGERAKRIEKLRGEMPVAKNNTEAIVADIDDRIRTIDKFLRNPARNQIIGPIEGNLPRFAQFGPRADAQADFDKIKNMATLSSLIDLRKSTETGASPVGANPTDRDAKIVETAASALIQTGELPKVDSEMQALRNKLYRMRENALNTYRDTYREVAAEAPELRLRVPSISPTYKRSSSQRSAAPAGGQTKPKTRRYNPATGKLE